MQWKKMEDVCSLILKESKRGCAFTSTSLPFFAQRPSSPTETEEVFLTQCEDLTFPCDLKTHLYDKLPSTEEVYAGSTTILSWEEVQKRRQIAVREGTENDFYDVAIEYVGMGRVMVLSVDGEGGAHLRVDGGANGYERLENFHKSLHPRSSNSDLLTLMERMSRSERISA